MNLLAALLDGITRFDAIQLANWGNLGELLDILPVHDLDLVNVPGLALREAVKVRRSEADI